MKALIRLLLTTSAILFAGHAWAINIFACEPEWGALATEIAGDKGSIFTATTAKQDPHRIEARPSLLARARNADLLICSGAQLEIGWLPLLLTQAGNSRIQPGTPGYFEASQFVVRLDVPKVLDRSMGDVHPAGNPHVHTDPRNIAKVADALIERLAQIDARNADTYRSRGKAFLERWNAAIARWEKQAAPLKGARVVVYHKDLSYLEAWLGLVEAGALEPKPGIPPSPVHLNELVQQMDPGKHGNHFAHHGGEPVNMIVYCAYQDPAPAQFLSQRTGVPVRMLPFTVGGTDAAKDLFGLFDDTIARLLSGLK